MKDRLFHPPMKPDGDYLNLYVERVNGYVCVYVCVCVCAHVCACACVCVCVCNRLALISKLPAMGWVWVTMRYSLMVKGVIGKQINTLIHDLN